MPTTIVKTIGAANANSYVDTTDGDAYFDDRLDAAKWTGASTSDKQRALLMAAKHLQFENWLGDRVTVTQALAWPRIGVAKVDGISGGYGMGYYGWGYGYPFDVYLTTEIPQPVKDAQCELALDFLAGVPPSGVLPSVDSFSLDGLNVKLTDPQTVTQPSRAQRLIAALVVGNRLVRG